MHLRSDKTEAGTDPRLAGVARVGAPSGAPGPVAQRLAAPEAVAELQRSVGNAAVVQLLRDEDTSGDASPVLDVVGRGGGQPLDAAVRAGMERALGADLSEVRVHADGAAAISAQAVQAHAYTVGNDVVFGAGQYQPGSATGQRTLAHELTHVVQQRSGPVSGTPTGEGISVSNPSDPFERAAEANADRVMAGVPSDALAPVTGPGASPVQRETAPGEPEEEEPVQGLWVQREDAPEEEDEGPAPA
jgi:hypothetical protein